MDQIQTVFLNVQSMYVPIQTFSWLKISTKKYIYTHICKRNLFQFVSVFRLNSCNYYGHGSLLIHCKLCTNIPLTDLHVQSTSFAFWELKISFSVLQSNTFHLCICLYYFIYSHLGTQILYIIFYFKDIISTEFCSDFGNRKKKRLLNHFPYKQMERIILSKYETMISITKKNFSTCVFKHLIQGCVGVLSRLNI